MENQNVLSNANARVTGLLKNVYLWMTAGLALTAVVSYLVGTNTRLLYKIYSTGTYLFLVLLELGLVFFLSANLRKMSTSTAIGAFILYSIVNGLMLSSIFAIYAGLDIFRAFFTTTAMFGAMSVFAMFTKRDLSTLGRTLLMVLWGLIAASVLNLFIKGNSLSFVIDIVAVAVFALLTAYDSQKIIALSNSFGDYIDEDTYIKLSIFGALELYLDFINIFLRILRLFANSRRD
ncbi:MAG: Bax inhibitor-1/YccA family protein [Sphaerochaetaceae bacterium]|nr:Bax inhibitor-1/YccA family protein [Sphaerochaetaceae bacterium]